jgi:hypothetical protein
MFRDEDGRQGRFLETFDQELRAQIADAERRQQVEQSKHLQPSLQQRTASSIKSTLLTFCLMAIRRP